MNPYLAATAAALILAAVYVLRCLANPWSVCARCDGTGERRLLFGGRLPCRRCDGTGKRNRLAYRVFGWAMAMYLAAQKARQAERRARARAAR